MEFLFAWNLGRNRHDGVAGQTDLTNTVENSHQTFAVFVEFLDPIFQLFFSDIDNDFLKIGFAAGQINQIKSASGETDGAVFAKGLDFIGDSPVAVEAFL